MRSIGGNSPEPLLESVPEIALDNADLAPIKGQIAFGTPGEVVGARRVAFRAESGRGWG
jgi:hypothetical protein